jgi:hypothetical protein
MKKYLISIVLALCSSNCFALQPDRYDSLSDKENFILAPLAEDHRALNTKGQCVWSSLQNMGRQIGETKLYNLTKDRRCQGGANPSDVNRVLTALGVKFEQAYGNRKEAYALIERGLAEGRPCIISYDTAHVINIVHFDRDANKVAVVNNHGDRFQTQYMDLAEFDRRFKGWVCIVYGPPEAEAKLKEFTKEKRLIITDFYAPKGKKPEVKDF